MHPDAIIKKLEDFRDQISLDVGRLKKISYFFRFLDAALKLPMMLSSAIAVLISSVNITENTETLSITILCLNSLLACLTSIYMYTTPSTKADKADICIVQLDDLANDVDISITELSVGGIMSEYDSENSTNGDREMYQRYLVMMTRFSMKKMHIDNAAPISLIR